MRKALAGATLVGLILLGQSTVHAVPILQLYIEGATWNEQTATWIYVVDDSSDGGVCRLWAIGNTTSPRGFPRTISDVKLSIAYSADDLGLGITLTTSTTGGYGGFTDDRPPPSPIQNGVDEVIETTLGPFPDSEDLLPATEVTNGGAPVLSDGSALPSHGIFYGHDVVWQEFSLGDFDERIWPIADFIGPFPTPEEGKLGQINVYEVSVTDWSGGTLHFDLYNSVEAANSAIFAPFSHDAEVITPEPASFVVWFLIGSICLVRGRAFQSHHGWRQPG